MCYKDTLAVLDTFLADFCFSNKVVKKKLLVFESVQKTRNACFMCLVKHLAIASYFKPDKAALVRAARVLNTT